MAGLIREPSGSFIAEFKSNSEPYTRMVLLATGVVDIEPELANVGHAIQRGYVRHCPIRDGFEVIDRKIAVIGFGKSGMGEALFMRAYSSDVTLLSLGRKMGLTREDLDELAQRGIDIIEEAVAEVSVKSYKITALPLADGREHRFDTLYSALGSRVRSSLALKLGAHHDDNQALIVDAHQKMSVPGLYAAGDVVSTLNQISVAMGQAAIAATEIHNRSPSVNGASNRL